MRKYAHDYQNSEAKLGFIFFLKTTLDSSKVIYADAAETLIPCAEQMVRELILKNENIIVILDNCSAELHSVLMKICKTEESNYNKWY